MAEVTKPEFQTVCTNYPDGSKKCVTNQADKNGKYSIWAYTITDNKDGSRTGEKPIYKENGAIQYLYTQNCKQGEGRCDSKYQIVSPL